jgi:hypothetical protein
LSVQDQKQVEIERIEKREKMDLNEGEGKEDK